MKKIIIIHKYPVESEIHSPREVRYYHWEKKALFPPRTAIAENAGNFARQGGGPLGAHS